MNLEEKKKELQENCDRHIAFAEALKKEYKKLEACIQPDNSEFYDGFGKFISVDLKKNFAYEHILGGDGRSQPWSEKRRGSVALVEVSEGIYLSDEQRDIVKKYVEDVYRPDHIEMS